MTRFAVLLLPLAVAGCFAFKPQPSAAPHYVLGRPYEAGGIWYYPHPSYSAEQTGIAVVYGGGNPPLTADGERFDQTALAAAHQTLQLPAIARVTNLENGRQVVLRINDRGPPEPSRLIAVTHRTAELLSFPASGAARVRLEVLSSESRASVEAVGGAPDERLAVATAPRGTVEASDLPPPGSGRAPGPVRQVAGLSGPGPDPGSRTAAPPLRLPEQVGQTAPLPSSLWIEMGSFSRREFAERQRARVAGLGVGIEAFRNGREETYRVRIGPFAFVPQADAVLEQVIRAGVTDARIIVQ